MPRYAITTFGCQMNVHDSERMHEVLRGAGFLPGDGPEDADVVLLNTCSVREKAEQKLMSEVGRLAKLKRSRPELLLVVAGCVAQQEGEKLLAKAPAIDLVVGPDQIPEIPGLIAELSTGGLPLVRTVFDTDAPRFLTAHSVLEGAATAFVTTMKGCDERCSFCIVPTTRGPERYRPSESIVAEIDGLALRGVREVTLLGQTVNSYCDPSGKLASSGDESEFADLLRLISASVPRLSRLRYTSPHPRHLGPSLIAAHRDLAVLARHVHLPVQSGSDRVLQLRASVPGVTVSTDVIVGFPGETDEDFRATLDLVEEVGFVGVFGFKYSPRPGTPALRLGDDVAAEVKSERLAMLFDLSERLIAAHLRGLVGTTQRVLIEGPHRSNPSSSAPREPAWSGRSEHNAIVHIRDAAGEGLVGEIVDVKIAQAFKHSLLGELDETTRARGLTGVRPRAKRRALPLVSHAEEAS
jgi:tRNA-2-methylthio-N6-dimethylallyladenosine synthase